MTLDTGSSAAAAAISFIIAWTAMVGWVWNVRSTAVNARDDLEDLKEDRERDKAAFNARLEKAEQTAEAVRELAAAVRHGGEMTAAQIKNLADRFAEHASDTKEQLSEVKEEQRNVRLALARRNSRAGAK